MKKRLEKKTKIQLVQFNFITSAFLKIERFQWQGRDPEIYPLFALERL